MKEVSKFNSFAVAIVIFILMNINISVCGQTSFKSANKPNDIVFYFDFDNSRFDENYMLNSKSINILDDIFDDSALRLEIDTLRIVAASSPEGKYNYNLQLAQSRVSSLEKMLKNRYPQLDKVIVEKKAYVADWSILKELLKKDLGIPLKKTVLEVLNSDLSIEGKGWRLKQIGNGDSWKYISKNYMKYLRDSKTSIQICSKSDEKPNAIVPEVELHVESELPKVESKSNQDLDTPTENLPEAISSPIEDLSTTTFLFEETKERKELFALKTNLLFDALSLINFEVEVPIGKRWSIAGEWIFPWWIWDDGQSKSKRNRIQMLNANLEGRYWLGNRDTRPKLTGWFGGVYVGGGLYDFEYKTKGYQGEFFIMGGLSAGYAHTINKANTLRMEYALGLGYVKTDYRFYEASFGADNEWHPIRQETGRYTYIGPTRLKVSLVWMLNYNKRRGGVR